MSFTQLSSPLPVFVIGKGKGMAFAVIDYGPEHNLIWVSAIDESGEIWCVPNPKVRMRPNWSMSRDASPEERRASSGAMNPLLEDDNEFAEAFADRSEPHLRAVHIPDADAEYSAFP